MGLMRAVPLLLHRLVLLAANEHAVLLGTGKNPVELGWEPVPLDRSYTHVPLDVMEGKVPVYLDGTLYRGAPGAWPDGWWLDGLITLNAFRFDGGRVTYSMQWNKDEAYNRTIAHSAPVPPLSVAPVIGGIPHPANSSWPTGVAFRQVQGHLVSSTGVSNVNRVDFDTLEPLEMPFLYEDELGAPYLAPTHEATVDGHVLHHLVTGMQKGSGGVPGYVVTSIKPGTRTRDVIARIEKPKESSPSKGLPSFQHMPLATSDYYIMLEAPCYYPDTATVVGNVDWKGWKSNLFAGGHVRLVSRSTGESTVYPLSSSIFAIHHFNAYHDAATNSIIVDTIKLFPSFVPCSQAFKGLTMDNQVKNWRMTAFGLSMSKPLRLKIPLNEPGKTIKPTPLINATGVEFPTIGPDEHNGKPYHYAYALWVSSRRSAYYDAIIKIDVRTGDYIFWRAEGQYPGEPIFVPDPDSGSEDDGVVMTNVLDVGKNMTYLLLLDARTMTQTAKVGPTPHVIPHGFHGKYYPRRKSPSNAGPHVVTWI